MKLDFIKNTLNEKNINLNKFISYYDFQNINEIFLPNELYDLNKQLIISGNVKIINKNYYPAFFSEISNHINGSGVFNGLNYLTLSNTLESIGFSCLIDYSMTGKYTYDSINNYYLPNLTQKTRCLLEVNSQEENNTKFNLKLLLNSSDRLLINFSGKYFDGQAKNEIFNLFLNHPIAEKNIASISIQNNFLNLNYHDLYNNQIYNKNIFCSGNYNFSKKNIKFCKSDNIYSGFSGIISNLLIFEEDISKNNFQDLAFNLLKTGEYTDNIQNSIIKTNILKSGFLNPTGIINTITGYQTTLEDNINDNYYIGQSNPIITNITGEKLDFKYIESGENIETTTTTKQNLYDLNLKQKYKPLIFKPVGLYSDYPVNLINI